MSLIRFGALAIVAFVLATFGADLVARMSVAGDPAGLAASEHLYWAAQQPVGVVMLLAPFLIMALICATVAKRSTMMRAILLFGVIAAALLSLYDLGYHGSQLALRDEQWTAAALSVGLLPFLAIPLLLIGGVAGIILVKTGGRRAPQN